MTTENRWRWLESDWEWMRQAEPARQLPNLPPLETEDNPVVARLYGPRGELVYIKRAKNTVSFGFG